MYFKNIWVKENLKKIKTTVEEAREALEFYLNNRGLHNVGLFYKLNPQYAEHQVSLQVKIEHYAAKPKAIVTITDWDKINNLAGTKH